MFARAGSLLRPLGAVGGMRTGGVLNVNHNINNINRTITRPLMLYLTGEEEDSGYLANHFAQRCEMMGADAYPMYKKEKFKRSAKRYMVSNRKIGKAANYKVRGLVDLIEYKRFYKFQ